MCRVGLALKGCNFVRTSFVFCPEEEGEKIRALLISHEPHFLCRRRGGETKEQEGNEYRAFLSPSPNRTQSIRGGRKQVLKRHH